MTRRAGLSKSRITAFEQCAKRLWLQVYRPDLAEADPGAQARFATGHEVGAIACALVPNGHMIEMGPDLNAALEETRDLLQSGHRGPLFEATLEHDGVLVRIDILEPNGDDAWSMAEVKSSTRVKDYHLGDLATQVWVAREAGVNINRASIRHISNEFRLREEGDYRGLLVEREVSAEIAAVTAGRAAVVCSARAMLDGPEPSREPGLHCRTPFPCEFEAYCSRDRPEGPKWPVSILPRGGGKQWEERGVRDLLAVDHEALGSALHQRVHRATLTGEPFHDCDAAQAAMASWAFPRTWLDFETIAFAVPRWIGTRPYQQTPFQFSAHVEDEHGGVTHYEFLSLDGGDPRRRCAEALLNLPPSGAVVAYNAAFERGCILDLADSLPDLAEGLRALAGRIVDLLPVTRACWYHRDQRGSWSIKAVLPTVAPELDYSNLEIKDGGNAQEAYLEAIAPETTLERRAQLDVALRAYCGRDTEAMIVLARHLAAQV